MPLNLLLIAPFVFGLYVCSAQYSYNSISLVTMSYATGGSKLILRMKNVAQYWIVGNKSINTMPKLVCKKFENKSLNKLV